MSAGEMSFERIHQALVEVAWFEAHRVARLDQIAQSTDRISPYPLDIKGLRFRYDALVAARDMFADLARYDREVRALLLAAKDCGRAH